VKHFTGSNIPWDRPSRQTWTTLPGKWLCGWLLALLLAPAQAAPGGLDTTFAGTGKAIITFGGAFAEAEAVGLQGDGRIVIAGLSGTDPNYLIAVARFLPDGSLDSSFGTAGKVTTPVVGSDDRGNCLAIQADGKIVVAGSSKVSLTRNDIAVVRYLSDGTLDTTFGTGGKMTTRLTGGYDAATGVAMQNDGKIVIACWANYNFGILRYLSDGSLDPTFGNGGSKITSIVADLGTPYIDSPYCLALQPDGRIVLAGYSYNGSNNDAALIRYLSDGILDASFGNGGIVTTAIGSSNDYARAIALAKDGKIVTTGYSRSTYHDLAVVRYASNGSLDPTFGNGGKVTTPGSGDNDGNALGIQSDSKLVVAGSAKPSDTGFQDFIVARYTSTGSLDATFGTGGKVITNLTTGNDVGRSLVLQKDGKIVVAGGAAGSAVVVRYQGGPFTPYDQWKLNQLGDVFTPDLGDNDGDRLVTLAEYALLLSPITPSQSPAANVFTYAEGDRLRMFVPRDPAHNDITVSVEATGDLATGVWTSLATSTLGAPFTGPGYVGGDGTTSGVKNVEVRDVVNISTATQRWMRVKVVH
jgi:uncharacterized delta-60 repeat protein